MKFCYLFSIFVCFISCNKDKKIYIKSLNLDQNKFINWYIYSDIEDYSPDYIEFSEGKSDKLIFEADQLTNINRRKDSLVFQVEGSYGSARVIDIYKFIDSSSIKAWGFKIIIDTTGHFENTSSSGLPRLHKKKVDIFKPHSFNSDYRNELTD